ncbi:InlB B-repeat-containing protein [Gemmiger sp.]
MARWKRVLGLALCLLAVCLLAALQAGADDLPISFSDAGASYRYAVPKKDPNSVTYGTSTVADVAGTATAALSGGGISVSLDTGKNKNFKLCYKEIPVTVTVPANTTYTVTFDFKLNATFARDNKNAGAKASFQVVYLGDTPAARKTVVFYPYLTSGKAIKTTINGSDANTNIVQKTMQKDGNKTTNAALTATKRYNFVNNTNAAKEVTKYFGVWIVGNYASTYPNQATAICTVTPTSVTYPLTFNANANEGTVDATSKTVTVGKNYGELPTATRAGGYTFDGWYTAKTGGTKITDTTLVSAAHGSTLYAHWTLTPAEPPVIDTHPSDQTIVYGKSPTLKLTYHGAAGHTISHTWYECDKDGKNGKPASITMPTAGVHYYYALVTATRKDNGQMTSKKSNIAKITVDKAVPDIVPPSPSADELDLAVCQTLSGSKISGGKAKNPTTREDVPGTFTWQDGTIRPKLGWQKFPAVFTPNDTANYTTTATTLVSVKVTCSHIYDDWVNGTRTCTLCGETEQRTNTVTVTWSDLAYTYEDGTWQPDTHTYRGSRWTVNSPGGDVITVQNEGANDVKVTLDYYPAWNFPTITGSFADSAGREITDAIALPVGGTETARLALSGRPTTTLKNRRIGSVTVRLINN